jgi:hypothetical protein
VDHINWHYFDIETLKKLILIHNSCPEEIDPLPDMTDSYALAQRIRNIGCLKELMDTIAQRFIIDRAIFYVRKRHIEFMQYLTGSKQAAERVSQPSTIRQWSFISGSPKKGRDRQLLGYHPDSAFRSKVTVRNEKTINSFCSEMFYNRLNMRLVFDQTIFKDFFKVDILDVPISKSLLKKCFVLDRILIAKDKLANRTQTQERFQLFHVIISSQGSRFST